MAASKVKIRIRLKGYDHSLVDQAAEKIMVSRQTISNWETGVSHS